MQDDQPSELSDFEFQPPKRERKSRVAYDSDAEGYGPAGYGSYAPGGYGQPGYGTGGGGGSGPPGGRSLVDYLNWMLRYAWIIVLGTLVGTVTGYYVFSITPETYQSWASIEVQRLKHEKADVDEEERVRLGGSAEIQAMLEKLRMPRIYQSVALNPVFAHRPEVVPEVREYILPWKLLVGEEVVENKRVAPSPQALAGMMPGWIQLSVRSNTNLVDVFASHTDPEVARDTLQVLLSEYETMTDQTIAGSEQYAVNFIMEKSKELQSAIMGSQSALSRYQGCLDLSARIDDAKASVIEMEKRYLPKWPDLIEAKQLISILRGRFSEELKQAVAGSKEEETFWKENAAEYEGLDGEGLTDAQLKLVTARASILRKSLETDEGILKDLSAQVKQADVSRGFAASQFAIIQPPTLPTAPVAPSLKSIVGQFAAGGFMAGVGLVFLLGFLDPSVRTVMELESQTQLPVIGAIPGPRRKGKASGKRELVLANHEDAHASEAIRTLRTGLLFLGDEEERRSFIITSALPGEGKSWVAANLAVSFAQQGDLTVIVDADLRKSVQCSVFDIDRETPGVTNYLSRQANFSQVCHKSGIENLWIIPSGARSPNPAELLGSRNLEFLMRELGQQFDRIIVDSAPLVPVSDTLSLTKWVQSVVLIYRMGTTPRKALLRALKSLRGNKAEPVGVVANALPRVSRRNAYGYYYSYAGGGNYGGYYGDSSKKK